MTVHRLKTWVPYFSAVLDGTKPFEVRYDDRGFRLGDRLRLVEVTPGTMFPTGREAEAEITYVLAGGRFGIAPDYVVLGLSAVRLREDDHHDR